MGLSSQEAIAPQAPLVPRHSKPGGGWLFPPGTVAARGEESREASTGLIAAPPPIGASEQAAEEGEVEERKKGEEEAGQEREEREEVEGEPWFGICMFELFCIIAL